MKKLLPIFFLAGILGAQQNVSFSEIMFYSNGTNSEFIELVNTSKYDTVDLTNWSIKYDKSKPDKIVGKQVILYPGNFLVIFENDYDSASGIYSNYFSYNIKYSYIEDNSFGSNGMSNTIGREIVLLNDLGDIVSVYTYSTDNPRGISDEKIKIENNNAVSNWGNSKIINGTPGFGNSITQKDYDVAIGNVLIDPQYPKLNEKFSCSAVIKNLGLKRLENVEVHFSFSSERVLKKDSVTINHLDVNDSVFAMSPRNYEMGERSKININVDSPKDEYPVNNSIAKFVSPRPEKYSIIVSEIMFNPFSGNPEWIELENRSGKSIDLYKWEISDLLSTPHNTNITNGHFLLNNNEFVILSKDTSWFNFLNIKSIKVPRLPQFGNSEDGAIIYDNHDIIIDSTSYINSWSINNGRSIERIIDNNALFEWFPSVDLAGHSAGRENSFVQINHADKLEVVINEIMYEPEATNSEFIEIYNNSLFEIQLASLLVSDDNKTYPLSLEPYLLKPYEYFLIASDSLLLNHYLFDHNEMSKISISKFLSLSNDGEEITLKNYLGDVVDYVKYSPSMHDEILLYTKNISLERISANSNSNMNWGSSADVRGATPLRVNSIFQTDDPEAELITIEPNPFSPDGDGFEDVCKIHLQGFTPETYCTIIIYDSRGRKVRNLTSTRKIGFEADIEFDGKNDNDETMDMGIYIALIKLFNESEKRVIKKVFVLANKL